MTVSRKLAWVAAAFALVASIGHAQVAQAATVSVTNATCANAGGTSGGTLAGDPGDVIDITANFTDCKGIWVETTLVSGIGDINVTTSGTLSSTTVTNWFGTGKNMYQITSTADFTRVQITLGAGPVALANGFIRVFRTPGSEYPTTWNASISGTNPPAPDPSPSTPSVPTWTLNFSANGGTCSVASGSDADTSWIPLPGTESCTREGYQLIGWNTSADGSGLGFAPGAQTQLTGNNTMYAQWRALAPAAQTPSSAPSSSATDSTAASASTTASTGAGVAGRRSASTTVFFNSDSAGLTELAKAKLRALVDKTGTKVISVLTVGYVQESGSNANDQSLSMARAQSVTEYLRSLGVRGRYTMRGEGISGPAASDRKATTTITYRP